MGWKTDILAVAESVQAGNKTMGGYSLGDLTIGLTYLAEERKAEQERDPGAKVKSLEAIGAKKALPSSKRLETLEWACKLADVAYIGQESVMRKHLLAELDLVLVHAEVESKYRVPAHCESIAFLPVPSKTQKSRLPPPLTRHLSSPFSGFCQTGRTTSNRSTSSSVFAEPRPGKTFSRTWTASPSSTRAGRFTEE